MNAFNVNKTLGTEVIFILSQIERVASAPFGALNTIILSCSKLSLNCHDFHITLTSECG